MFKDAARPETGGDALLLALKDCGIDYLFANAGTDFPPIIEGFARLSEHDIPIPVTVPHETAGMAMAHGHWLVTGRPQAVMVHVNVGLANAVMGVINAASDDVPVFVLSGRTPLTETGRKGGRMTPIQYGQEMYDQTSLVRDVVKFDYELRFPEQADSVTKRAAAIMQSAPQGPVYMSLPKEPLADHLPEGFRPRPAAAVARPTAPDPGSIRMLADWIAESEAPVVLCQRGDPFGVLGQKLSDCAAAFGLGVVEPFSIRNVLASEDPAFLGYDAADATDGADLVIVLDSGIPWIEAANAPSGTTRVVHIGPDPLFRRMPVRGYQSDLAITSDPVLALDALLAVGADAKAAERQKTIQTRRANVLSKRLKLDAGGDGPMSAEWMSRCISDVMDDQAIAFTELGLLLPHMSLSGPNRVFSNVHAGGLGWAMPAALGAQLADRERLVISCMGDGSYMFANPVACHQIAEALELPILTVIKNNAMWNAVRRSVVKSYPQGAAVRMNRMPLTSLEPVPDFTKVASASRAYTEKVATGAELPAALNRALEVIRTERRQVLLDLSVAPSDTH
jgi:acetolactate synthase-1/2/3 large subunit